MEKDFSHKPLPGDPHPTVEDTASVENLKSEFISNISHELRTPLNTIIGYTEMLAEDLLSDGLNDYSAVAEKVLESSKYILERINAILDLSKIETGKMELFLEEVSVKGLLEEIESAVASSMKKSGNTLEVNFSFDINTIYTDLVRVRQSLVNLLDDAGKFTQNNKIILDVFLVPHQDKIQFSVKYTHSTISPQQLKKLFQSFAQTPTAETARQYGSIGLSLYLTRRFCEMLGGNIALESHDDNLVIFSIVLPIKTIPRDNSSLTPQNSAFTATYSEVINLNTKTILVIDDAAFLHQKMQELLGEEGYNILHAFDGDEGLKLARINKPAAILLELPDVITLDLLGSTVMDGWATLSALKSQPGISKIPVIVISKNSQKNLGFALNGVHYFSKPLNIPSLVTKIKQLVPPTNEERLQ